MAEDFNLAVRIGMRQAGDRMAALEAELQGTEMEFLSFGRRAGGSHIDKNRALSVQAFAEASEMVIDSLIARKGERAINRRDELVAAMEKLRSRAQSAFDRHDGSPHFPTNRTARQELDLELNAKAHRILLDFDEGVYQMANESKDRGGISIGNINQMAGHIGNNNQGPIRAQQNFNETDLLAELAAAIKVEVADAEERGRILGAIEEMRRVQADKLALGAAYAGFISLAAGHMTVVAPFLPALAQMLT